jgi:hypothetical protein
LYVLAALEFSVRVVGTTTVAELSSTFVGVAVTAPVVVVL